MYILITDNSFVVETFFRGQNAAKLFYIDSTLSHLILSEIT